MIWYKSQDSSPSKTQTAFQWTATYIWVCLSQKVIHSNVCVCISTRRLLWQQTASPLVWMSHNQESFTFTDHSAIHKHGLSLFSFNTLTQSATIKARPGELRHTQTFTVHTVCYLKHTPQSPRTHIHTNQTRLICTAALRPDSQTSPASSGHYSIQNTPALQKVR